LEAFMYGSAGVKRWFDERGQLPTERALLDDNGDGLGREADDPPNADGAVARVTYLRPDPALAAPAGSELTSLTLRRAEVQAQLDALQARKAGMPAAAYDAELERLLLDLARIDREIRSRNP
jgi:hypothetical protein